jgi:serine protease AprX
MPNGERPERLFIKLILPKQGREHKVSGGGGPVRPFRSVTPAFRGTLSNQVRAIERTIRPLTRRTGGAPVRVRLLPKAFAKSHRPEHLFSDQTCPIIGAGKLGELFLKATPSGLEALDRVVRTGASDRIVKELSTVEAIEPITTDFRRRGLSSEEILRSSPLRENWFATQVQLFDFGPGHGQEALVADFQEACRSANLRVRQTGYSETSFRFQVDCRTVADVDALSNVVGVRSLQRMPTIRTIRPQTLNAEPLPDALPTPAGSDSNFPVVVVVDSGVIDTNPQLNGWIVGRESNVAPAYRNPEHGTFVAGLVCWGKQLNPALAGLDSNPCGVFDLQVIPNWDPARGPVESLYEAEFLQVLESALQQYGGRYKVWNLSLGLDQVCSLTEFSGLAVQLDDLQERYNVSFVVSAGNYESVPLLSYPRTAAEMDPGRITSPADSVLSVSVGSISHHRHAGNGPATGDPSSFSRHGAGPNYVIKPDLVHYGGTCCTDGSDVRGVRSVTDGGAGEAIGTSFAAPLVSRILANIYHQVTPPPSPVLSRAILTHHARDSRTGGRVADTEENFIGFGLPAPLPYCLECTPSTSTMIFEDVLRPGYYLEWDDFPYPDSLKRSGRYYGDIWMTVAFSPARNPRWGSEYCETHIDAHFGVWFRQRSRETGRETIKFKGLVPPEHKNPGVLFESFQVEHLRKWAPVRTYFGSLGESGVKGDRWRLKVQLLARHGIEEAALTSQSFALILTIADPNGTAAIYDEMARQIRSQYRSQNLIVRPAVRVR